MKRGPGHHIHVVLGPGPGHSNAAPQPQPLCSTGIITDFANAPELRFSSSLCRLGICASYRDELYRPGSRFTKVCTSKTNRKCNFPRSLSDENYPSDTLS